MAQKIETIVSYVDDVDSSCEATTARTFEVGARSYVIDLGDENAARIDRDFAEWTTGWRKRTFAYGRKTYTRWLRPDEVERFDTVMAFWTKAARRLKEDETSQDGQPVADGRSGGPLPVITPVPAQGQQWWMDPPRPLSRETTRRFSEARRAVREWARDNGWDDLGTRGVVPRSAYERWFNEVWSTMADPSWENLAHLPVPGTAKTGKSRRRTK
ncbi:histone-like nucleoid-structuring protein Lsr2 [Amycolatopsis sp. lyj-84]|uniref:Lsr2 dimerization domain-containing protein n=1 Tax=Amycolatopsis sp. lyj-84 TaxID=2789284 RepID=UPI003978FCE7